MTRLPLSVISGYLGAGKTTLVNRLLAEDHGLRLLVMVNDFGAINIDETLIAATGEDTIALTNGCVCCSMGADLYLALGDILQRESRPDHIVIEASGIADPAAIANAAKAEPQLAYAGIITLVDGLNAGALLSDRQIAPQVLQQMRVADLLLLTKTPEPTPELAEALSTAQVRQPLALPDEEALAPLLFGTVPGPGALSQAPHPGYLHWHRTEIARQSRSALDARLRARPRALYRLKGFVPTPDGMVELHVVGNHHDIRRSTAKTPGLVGIAIRDHITAAHIDRWWDADIAESTP